MVLSTPLIMKTPPSIFTSCKTGASHAKDILIVPVPFPLLSNLTLKLFALGIGLPTDSKVFDNAAETVHVKSRDLSKLVAKLNEMDINQVFVEAGSKLASAMVAAGLMDELVIYQAPALLGSGKSFFVDESKSTIEDQMRLQHVSTEVLAGDVKSVYRIGVGV